MHLQCIDNELQHVFKAQRVCVDFSSARFSQIGSQMFLGLVIFYSESLTGTGVFAAKIT